MKTTSVLIVTIFILLATQLNAQCTGGRYHDLVFPGNPVVTYNVVYGSNLNYLSVTDSLKMDIYEPACDNGTNRALVVFAHGGSFVTGDKGDAGYVQTAVALAKLGYVVANINYRLGFETSFPAVQYSFNSAIMRGVHDSRAAVRYCRNNALNGGNTWRIDPANIFFGGVSAGGIIALHLAYQNLQNEHNMSCNNQAGSECSSIEGTSNNLPVSSSVKAIVSISGGIRDLNWITTNDIPVFLAHGTNDGTVPYGSGTFGGFFPVHGSSSIATRCSTTGTKYCFKPMYGQDHVPSNQAYIDTVATVMRNFLEHFTCGIALNCNYTSSPSAATSSVSIAITSGTNPTCSGSSVTFTATAINGGLSPSYQWKKNGSNIGLNSTTFTSTTLANNDMITCAMTPDASCSTPIAVTSNSITMTVNVAGAPSITIAITSGSNPTCTGLPITFTATPNNGGSTPSYQWQVNGSTVGISNSYTSSALINNAMVNCVLTSNSSCANPTSATSNAITLTVNPIPVITQNGNELTSSPSSSYKWYRNGQVISSATSQTYTATASGNYTVIDANNCQSDSVNVTATSSIERVNNSHFLTAYPNPNNGTFNVSFNVSKSEIYKLEIKNALGASCYEEIITNVGEYFSRQIVITKFGKGIYLIMLTHSKNETIKKVVVY